MHEFMQADWTVDGGGDIVAARSGVGAGLDRGDFASKITVYGRFGGAKEKEEKAQYRYGLAGLCWASCACDIFVSVRCGDEPSVRVFFRAAVMAILRAGAKAGFG
jgi:hypothetical protein